MMMMMINVIYALRAPVLLPDTNRQSADRCDRLTTVCVNNNNYCLLSSEVPSESPRRGSWSTPSNCVPRACKLRAEWSLDVDTDLISFTVAARQPQTHWTGIGFAAQQQMVQLLLLSAFLGFIQGSHASWKVLDFFLENSRTWKVLENHFGPGKFWKLKLKVLESPGNISLKVMHFSSGSNGKQAAIV